MEEFINNLSMDIEKNEREKLRKVFPQCFSDGKLDIDRLLNLCGEYQQKDNEKYKFEWKGKAECFQIAGKRTTGTLRPCREESVNFDDTQNLYIEGDNLEVLKILQKSYFNKVKMIYIDPPYNTGNDFVYEDTFKDPIQHYKEVTSQTTKSNPETMGRFHTAWLNMMFPRLRLAYNLLREDGVIFISIDDHEVHNLRKICDEIFGEENFIAQINWKGRGGRQDSRYYAVIHEYILCYAKNLTKFKSGEGIKTDDIYNKYDELKKRHYKTQLARKWGSNSKKKDRPNLFYPIKAPDGTDLFPMISDIEEGCWRWSKIRMENELNEGNIEFVKNCGKWVAYEKIYEPLEGEKATKKYTTWIDEVGSGSGTDTIKKIFSSKIFDYSKPTELIKKFILMADLVENDIILDFFSGSATTAQAVMELNKEDGGNRKFIMVQLPELCGEDTEAFKNGYKNICEIGKERIRRAGKKLIGESNQTRLEENKPTLDVGFKVFKLDSSNLKAWDSSPLKGEGDEAVQELIRRLDESVNRRKPDRTDLDMVYEIILKLGIQLTEPIIKMNFDGKTVYSIKKEHLLLVCLDKNLETETIDKMTELAPAHIVFGQECFEDVSAMSNAKLLLRRKRIDMKFV